MSDLRELLTSISDHAGVYEVTERSYVLGRRRVVRRRAAWAAAGATVAVVTLLTAMNLPGRTAPDPAITPTPSPSAVTLSSCSPAELPVHAKVRRDEFRHLTGDPSGRILAARGEDISGDDIVAIWTDDVPTAVVKVSDQVSEVAAVSPNGIVVLAGMRLKDGSRGQTQYTSLAWVYQDGTVTRLRGEDVFGSAVNTAGTVVGMAGRDLVVWRDATAEPQRLAVPEGATPGAPMEITDDGTVVATLYRDGIGRLQLWSTDGTSRPLASPDTIDGAPVVDSRIGQFADGWVSGTITTRQGETRRRYAARWHLSDGEVEWFGGGPGGVTAVNPQGWAVFQQDARLTLIHADTAVPVPGVPDYSPTTRTGMDMPIISLISSDGRSLVGSQTTLAKNMPSRHLLRWTCR
ncbi:hypothetical protein [Catellatospora tritici]|uniref:hypothetical protein n=1 Tax=Catellatospora tritici TaxID=2851566 RepID=UPI001C2DDD2F|nr:hypothetical protein [Catellatospora tritici]MBV1850613.1 hypothetical protein [Catellatospora tritici]